jgi:hypothetical protein
MQEPALHFAGEGRSQGNSTSEWVPLIFLFSPLIWLEEELVTTLAGKSLTSEEIYHEYHNGRP